MLVSKAKAILEQYDDDSHMGVLFITPAEVQEVCGLLYDGTDEILDSLSREPEGHFWYTHRDMFKSLIATAHQNRKEWEDGRHVRDSNDALQHELGLKRIIMSLSDEVRPMSRVSPVEMIVQSLCFATFTLPENSNYAELVLMLDEAMVKSDDHHVFLEDIRVNHDNGMIEVSFGS